MSEHNLKTVSSERMKNSSITQWGNYTSWAIPAVPMVGQTYIIKRDARSLKIDRDILIQTRNGVVITLWDSQMRPIADCFMDNDCEAVVVQFVEHATNTKWKDVVVHPFESELDLEE